MSVSRACVLVFLTLALSKAGSAQLVLYDNFKSDRIGPSKWIGTFGDPDQREVVRQVVGEEEDRRLHLSQTAYSATTDDVGSSGNIFGLEFPGPSAITEASFTLVVKNAVAVGCTSNSQPTLTGPEFRGRFFNTEISPTSQLGDVEVGIGPLRASTDAGSTKASQGFPSVCRVFTLPSYECNIKQTKPSKPDCSPNKSNCNSGSYEYNFAHGQILLRRTAWSSTRISRARVGETNALAQFCAFSLPKTVSMNAIEILP